MPLVRNTTGPLSSFETSGWRRHERSLPGRRPQPPRTTSGDRVCQDNQHYYFYYCDGYQVQCKSITSDLSLNINEGLGQKNTIAVVANGIGFDLYINNRTEVVF